MPMTVTPMTIGDLKGVLAIENAAFCNPWSRNSFLYELQENQRAVYLVAREDDRVVGYTGMWVIFDEGHITNLAVHPGYRRRGVGTRLLDELTSVAKARRVSRLTLEVRVSNIGAQSLYAKHGFVNCGIRNRYYRDNNEDAIIMWKSEI